MSMGTLLERFNKLRLGRTTKRGCKFLLPPDKKDYRWGLRHFGGVEPITEARAEKLITKMEKWQKGK